MANWERKSSYLLQEIVKFRTYIDSLTAARVLSLQEQARRRKEGEDADFTASARGIASELNRELDRPQLRDDAENGDGGDHGVESVVVTTGVECSEAEIADCGVVIDFEEDKTIVMEKGPMDDDGTFGSTNITTQ